VHELHRHRALADGGGDAQHRLPGLSTPVEKPQQIGLFQVGAER
jgi:hypothetical protein